MIELARFIVHYGGHFLLPGLIAYIFFRTQWKKAWLLMILTMIIDLDHLVADPIFDPERCSINYHFLHQTWAVFVYFGLFLYKKTRVLGLGLLVHLLIDGIDCLWMNAV
ncbi:DUF6122 family protein [Flavobacteriaceae bacterium F08102]|nr:DUF6122 family protein [Flavobacteriaceae bacterium F08102]